MIHSGGAEPTNTSLSCNSCSAVTTTHCDHWRAEHRHTHVPDDVTLKHDDVTVTLTFDLLDTKFHHFIILSCQTFVSSFVIITEGIIELWTKIWFVGSQFILASKWMFVPNWTQGHSDL